VALRARTSRRHEALRQRSRHADRDPDDPKATEGHPGLPPHRLARGRAGAAKVPCVGNLPHSIPVVR
jgi:hypothetical protein